MARFSAAVARGAPPHAVCDEFKLLVREAHKRGMEVILDVVFNHTAEGNEKGPCLSFRGLDNRIYYMLAPGGEYYNYSGCGNTLNTNHPVVRDFILDCLRYWVTEYHVDGFRFDLASILTRAHSAWHPATLDAGAEQLTGALNAAPAPTGPAVDPQGESVGDGYGYGSDCPRCHRRRMGYDCRRRPPPKQSWSSSRCCRGAASRGRPLLLSSSPPLFWFSLPLPLSLVSRTSSRTHALC